jgi:hypothetical protein
MRLHGDSMTRRGAGDLSEAPGLGKAVATHTDDAVEQVEHFGVSGRYHSEICHRRHFLCSIISAGVGCTQDGPSQRHGAFGARVDYDATRKVTDGVDGNLVHRDMSQKTKRRLYVIKTQHFYRVSSIDLAPLCTFSAPTK